VRFSFARRQDRAAIVILGKRSGTTMFSARCGNFAMAAPAGGLPAFQLTPWPSRFDAGSYASVGLPTLAPWGRIDFRPTTK
jgi:hypothetical protein